MKASIRWLLMCTYAAGLALSFDAVAAGSACLTSMDVLYCQTPGALMRVYPVWMEIMDLRLGGATPARLRVFYAGRCWVVPADTAVRIADERHWRARNDAYQLARVTFDEARVHEEERYSADGEYLGKQTVSYSGGWTFKKSLMCRQ